MMIKKVIHPNDDVNHKVQNDTFPTGMHLLCYKMIVEKTIPVQKLKNTL